MSGSHAGVDMSFSPTAKLLHRGRDYRLSTLNMIRPASNFVRTTLSSRSCFAGCLTGQECRCVVYTARL